MNIEYFYSFIEAVNQKSLSKASERLNISQPALSKQIRKVEEYFDMALLNRLTSGVELTEAGELVYNRLPNLLSEVVSIQNDLNHLRKVRTYSIGTLPSLAGNYIPSKVLKLKEKGVTSEVVVKNSSAEIYEMLKKGEVDAAIIEAMPISNTLWQRELFKEPLYAIVHVSNKLADKKSVSIDEISNEEFVLYPSNCTIRQSISRRVKELKVKTEVEFGEFLIGYVAAGGGITVVPEITAKYMGHTMVRAIPISDDQMKRHISLIAQSKETGKLLYSVFKGK
jgi:LysR family transcriptional regulator, transcription activator of glutamate synthase operon